MARRWDSFRSVGNVRHRYKADYGTKNGASSANHFVRRQLRRAERHTARQQIDEQLSITTADIDMDHREAAMQLARQRREEEKVLNDLMRELFLSVEEE